MKNLTYSLTITTLMLLLISTGSTHAQNTSNKAKIGVISLDVVNLSLTNNQAAKVLRNALIELDTFEVIDIYDMEYILQKENITDSTCLNINCLVNVGKTLNADIMMTGIIERLLGKIVVSLRIIDVQTSRITNRKLIEFVDVEDQLKEMIRITLNEMFGHSSDKAKTLSLTNEYQFESSINKPEITKLQLSGPRIGLTALTGENAQIYRNAEQNGGFDGRSVLFQFGYQFEVSYLNEGPIQALFEFIPMISGVDQGRFVPSVSLLNGIRSNVSGWEFAIGPVFSMAKFAEGYYNENNEWIMKGKDSPEEAVFVKRLDSRGDPQLNTGLIFAFGKSFKSGKINFPVNIFTVVNRNSYRFGISMGFNASENQ